MQGRAWVGICLFAFAFAFACAQSGEDPLEMASSAASRSPADRIIVWQQNLEAMKAAAVAPHHLTDAMLQYPYRPDIVLLQEAWQKVLCGSYLAEAAQDGDPDANNWIGSLMDANGLAKSCRMGRAPRPGSVLR